MFTTIKKSWIRIPKKWMQIHSPFFYTGTWNNVTFDQIDNFRQFSSQLFDVKPKIMLFLHFIARKTLPQFAPTKMTKKTLKYRAIIKFSDFDRIESC